MSPRPGGPPSGRSRAPAAVRGRRSQPWCRERSWRLPEPRRRLARVPVRPSPPSVSASASVCEGSGRLQHLATLRCDARRLAAARSQARDEILGHARRGRPAGRPHLLERRNQLLAGDAEFLREFVDPHIAPVSRSRSVLSLAASPGAKPARHARSNARRSNAAARHARRACTYAPLPAAVRVVSTCGPSDPRTTRTSECFIAVSLHPTHVLIGRADATTSLLDGRGLRSFGGNLRLRDLNGGLRGRGLDG